MKFLRGLCYIASIIICAYICSFIGMFELTGLPARNENGWLGPTLRFETEPAENDKATFYTDDSKVYTFYKPLSNLWLKAQTLPEESELGANSRSGAADSPTMTADEKTTRSGESGRGRRRRPDGENLASRDSESTSPTLNRSERGPRPRERSTETFTGERRRPRE